jgi:glycosyltransferase involved in cell wall biosynthesis
LHSRRILHCIASMLGGGAERQLAYLTAEFVKRGWETHVALIQEGPNLSRLISNGVIVHRLSCSGNHDPRLAVRLYDVMRQLDPVAVQTWLPQMDIIGGTVCLASGTPWVLSERGSGFGYGRGLKARIRRILGSHSGAVVANSTVALDYWQEFGLRHSPTRRVIANIVPLDEIDGVEPATQVHGLALGGDQWVIYAGRLEPAKNVRTLLRALELVVQNSKAKALICGDGSLRSEMEEYIQERRLGHKLVMCGYVSTLCGLLKRSSAFVSLSGSEGSPNAVLEAMACRCPIIVSDIPGHREVLDDASALFVPSNSAEMAAAAILKVLEGAPAVFARAELARRSVMDRKAERVAEQYEDVYQLVAGAHSVLTAP